jgi:hypothetical protein
MHEVAAQALRWGMTLSPSDHDALSGDPTFFSAHARDRLACYVRLRTEISPLPG